MKRISAPQFPNSDLHEVKSAPLQPELVDRAVLLALADLGLSPLLFGFPESSVGIHDPEAA